MKTMMTARLILAILSTLAEEVAIVIIWRWGLPELGIYLPLSVLIGVMVAWVAVSVTIFVVVTQALRRQTLIGLPTMVGSRGKVACLLAPEGLVRIKSELWSATSVEGEIEKDEEVMVVGEKGLMLIVRRTKSAA